MNVGKVLLHFMLDDYKQRKTWHIRRNLPWHWCPKALMGSMQYIKPPAQVCGVIVFDGFYQLHQGHRTSADPPWPQFKRFLSPQQLPTAAVDSAPRFKTPRTATWMIKCPQSLNPHSHFCKLLKYYILGV